MNTNEKYNGETLALMFAKENDGAYAVVIEEGTGDNLWDEDIEKGYVDYINWELFTVKMDYGLPLFREWDVGMILTKDYVQDMTVEKVCDLVRQDVGCMDIPFTLFTFSELSIANV